VVNKITSFVEKFQAFIGIVAAVSVAIIAFNEEMKKHYPKPSPSGEQNPE
jgi:hypothetical protein